jgi:hypothetical protein
VFEHGLVSVGAVPDEFGDQPQLKANDRNEVLIDVDVEVVLPGSASDALTDKRSGATGGRLTARSGAIIDG